MPKFITGDQVKKITKEIYGEYRVWRAISGGVKAGVKRMVTPER